MNSTNSVAISQGVHTICVSVNYSFYLSIFHIISIKSKVSYCTAIIIKYYKKILFFLIPEMMFEVILVTENDESYGFEGLFSLNEI